MSKISLEVAIRVGLFSLFNNTILSETVLTYFDPNKLLILIATDASPTGLGAVLSHKFSDGSERPIEFAEARALTSSEKNYSQIDKEAIAIFWGLKSSYITDHNPLNSIFHPHQTLPALSTMRLFHYAHFLSWFNYNIEYRPSLKNANADFL